MSLYQKYEKNSIKMSKKVKFLRFSQKEGAFEPPFKKLFVDFDKSFDKARQGSTKQLFLALLHELPSA